MRDRNTPQKAVWRARIVLPASDGLRAEAIAATVGAAHGLKPHLVETFKISRDKNFAAKVEDVSDTISIHPTRRWSCASTKRAKSKPSTALNRDCPRRRGVPAP